MTYILGISAFYHDSAATLIKDGKIIAAAQEDAEPSAARFVDEFLGNGKIERFDKDSRRARDIDAVERRVIISHSAHPARLTVPDVRVLCGRTVCR